MNRHLMLSYPKSGRTWLRFLLNHAMSASVHPSPRNVFEIEKDRPDVNYPLEWTHLTAAMVMKLPYWSMGCFDPQALRGRKAFLLIREPRATLASAYFQATNRVRVFQGTPSEFVRSSRYGAIKLATFFNLWHEIASVFDDTLVLQYEAMLEDPGPAIDTLVSFLDLPIDDVTREQAIEAASFENMKRVSTTPEYAGTVVAPTDPNNPDSAKVRSGTRTGYRDLFNDDDLKWIDAVMAHTCQRMPEVSAYASA